MEERTNTPKPHEAALTRLINQYDQLLDSLAETQVNTIGKMYEHGYTLGLIMGFSCSLMLLGIFKVLLMSDYLYIPLIIIPAVLILLSKQK